MADINIQRKKKSASPWLLILLVLALVGLGAWYLLRRDSAPEPAASTAAAVPAATPADTAAASQAGAETTPRPAADTDNLATETSVAPADFYAFVADDPASESYARRGLLLLSNVLIGMADRGDLRDATVEERRNDLTSATSRLEEPNASLRPGFVAAADMLRALQQRGYTTLERDVNTLRDQAMQLSGRTTTQAEQQATQEFFQQAANVLRVLEKPAP
ncbi:hypothetical protein F0P96_15060 [Hymenobacter busanensis]|uniref:Uncharacterized protein n=1 Tax=Hymenobacter busanensis TaxID=2607656 RepID=A0A7L4ZYX6_9BACT|nr:hypothetical protein [Hymenobacter busanensis]KAA9331555.1 hypothetical protein F0P96_15060 [Hymenobacter busanensis]QHJ08709.1 hypothetical protein GUY19_15995 [Hymenobacter busanensis]